MLQTIMVSRTCNNQFLLLSTTTKMIHFTTLFALVVGGTKVIQPAAAGVLTGLTLVNLDAFQRRQATGSGIQVPAQCAAICNPINSILTSDQCSPSQCCLASFENSYFNCLSCVGVSANVTDYGEPQSIIDTLYDDCASLGIQLPVLTFPGQNSNRALSSVVPSQTTISVITSAPTPSIVQTTISVITSAPTPSIVQTIITALTSSTTAAATAAATATMSTSPTIPNSSPTLSSGIRPVEISCVDLIAIVMMLGTWFYFAM